MSNIRKFIGLTVAAAALAVGLAGQASAAATFLACGYQADDGTLWETRYVYPATRHCPATSVKNGKEGALVYEEVINW